LSRVLFDSPIIFDPIKNVVITRDFIYRMRYYGLKSEKQNENKKSNNQNFFLKQLLVNNFE
jgi:hypothetical protein